MKWFSLALALLVSSSLAHATGETLSPNMSLPVPGVGVTVGPDWAEDINVSLGIIDGHDHSPGNGVQITPSGLNINSDLSFNNTNISLPRSVRYTSQVAPLAGVNDISSSYVSAGDLYFNDGSGNQVRITQGGSLAGAAGTITGLPSGTASAAFNSGQGTFIFQQATSTAANMDIGTLILRYPGSYPTPSGNYIAFEAPASLATGYVFTLPNSTPVSSGAFFTSDTSGALSYTNVDNSTLQNSAGTIAVKDAGITNAKMAVDSVATANIQDGAGTIIKLGGLTAAGLAFNQTITGGAGDTGLAAINISVVKTDRPVLIFLTANGSGGGITVPSGQTMTIKILRDGVTNIYQQTIGSAAGGVSAITSITFPLAATLPDYTTVGSHSYTIVVNLSAGSNGNATGVIAAIQL